MVGFSCGEKLLLGLLGGGYYHPQNTHHQRERGASETCKLSQRLSSKLSPTNGASQWVNLPLNPNIPNGWFPLIKAWLLNPIWVLNQKIGIYPKMDGWNNGKAY